MSALLKTGILTILLGHCAFSALSQVNVLTYHNDNARSGANLKETLLSPANVNEASFGKLFANSVDGQVYAEPLYVSGLSIPGKAARNVVFVATQHNSVYAFDADTAGVLLWQTNLGPSAATPSPDFGTRYGSFSAILPEIGITSTPVIDLASGRSTSTLSRTKARPITTNCTHWFSRMAQKGRADRLWHARHIPELASPQATERSTSKPNNIFSARPSHWLVASHTSPSPATQTPIRITPA